MDQQKAALGVLVLHGFTGSLDTVRPAAAQAEALGFPVRMPLLRGHGTRWEDLQGVRSEDWIADAKAALDELLGEAERVLVVGLSMGGLVALNLAADRPAEVAGLVLLAPALRFADPMTNLTPLLAMVASSWPSPQAFWDPERAKANTNYPRFPTAAFRELWQLGFSTDRRLDEVTAPVVVLAARRDQIVSSEAIAILQQRLASRFVAVEWFSQSGHEMLQDLEAEAVAHSVGEALRLLARRRGVSPPAEQGKG